MLNPEALRRLKEIIGEERVKAAPEDLVAYSYDGYLRESLPGAVVFPQSTEEVSAIMKLCAGERIPVTPRGAGTNLSGGSIPVPEGIVLCLTRMNRILEIDERNRLAVAEAGVINGDLQKAVEAKNLFYPPDPSSQYISTLGGNVSENAGGLKCVKYGTTRDYLLALEVVLPSGAVIQTGSRTAKNVTGYDMTRLLCGSEGTLGIITKITVRLLPKPEMKRALQAIFPDLGEAGETVARILGAGITPSIMEVMDQAITGAVEDFTHIGLPKDAEAVMLIEVDGEKETVERQISQIAQLCAKGGATEVKVARSDEENEAIWLARRSVFGALARLSPTTFSEDTTVPVSELPTMLRKFPQIAEKYKVRIAVVAHAGDGNIHPCLSFDERDQEEKARVELAAREIVAESLALGGTLSGEHGIGISKARFLPMEFDPATLQIMREIKRSFDPLGILSPNSFVGQKLKG
ncbi:MAG: FAD-linked oxidase C-terminal domain-containing protein [bacterium]